MKSPILSKGDTIMSNRNSRKLKCYNVSPVYVGESITRYEYFFMDMKLYKSRKIKQTELENMLSGVWTKITE